MSVTTVENDPKVLRRLAQVSLLFALASVLVTAAALVLLPNAAASGQWVVVWAGGLMGLSAFAFGVMISLRKPFARRLGFVVVALACLVAVLFCLLVIAVPDSAIAFGVCLAVVVAYTAFATHRLVRWPTGLLADEPRSSLGLFISYRRDDSRETVGRIHDVLKQGFEEERLFLDVYRQAAGDDYRLVIGRALDHAQVVLVVIGACWLTVSGRDGGRRIDDPEDMVRIEIETALARGLKVIPLLVQGAAMPTEAQLPPTLHQLAYLTALQVRPDPDFEHDMQLLISALRELSGAEGPD